MGNTTPSYDYSIQYLQCRPLSFSVYLQLSKLGLAREEIHELSTDTSSSTSASAVADDRGPSVDAPSSSAKRKRTFVLKIFI